MRQKLNETIRNIANGYRVSKKVLRDNVSFSSDDINYQNPWYMFYRDCEIAFSKLDDDEKFVISYEYFAPLKSGWWKKFYIKKDFMRISRSAVRKFVRYFYEIH